MTDVNACVLVVQRSQRSLSRFLSVTMLRLYIVFSFLTWTSIGEFVQGNSVRCWLKAHISPLKLYVFTKFIHLLKWAVCRIYIASSFISKKSILFTERFKYFLSFTVPQCFFHEIFRMNKSCWLIGACISDDFMITSKLWKFLSLQKCIHSFPMSFHCRFSTESENENCNSLCTKNDILDLKFALALWRVEKPSCRLSWRRSHTTTCNWQFKCPRDCHCLARLLA